MQIIFEKDIENTDFLEIILTIKEAQSLLSQGAVEEFSGRLSQNKILNVYVRTESKFE